MSKSKLPVLMSVGVSKTDDMYTCFILRTQGNKVIEKKIMEFASKDESLDQLKAEVIKIFWLNQEI